MLLPLGNRVKTAFRIKHSSSTISNSTSSEMFQISVLQTQKEYSSLLPKEQRELRFGGKLHFPYGLLMN